MTAQLSKTHRLVVFCVTSRYVTRVKFIWAKLDGHIFGFFLSFRLSQSPFNKWEETKKWLEKLIIMKAFVRRRYARITIVGFTWVTRQEKSSTQEENKKGSKQKEVKKRESFKNELQQITQLLLVVAEFLSISFFLRGEKKNEGVSNKKEKKKG